MNGFFDEARLVRRDPAVRWALLVLMLLTGFCLWNGHVFKQARDAAAWDEAQRSQAKQAADIRTVSDELAGRVPVQPWGASEPTKAAWNATRLSGPLAFLSFGAEDINPLSASVSLWMVRHDNLFTKYEFGSPLAQVAGRFDAGFLVVLLLPLFILALSYGVIAEERASGRLRLAVIQGEGVAARLIMRLALRLVPVYLSLLVILVVAASWTDDLWRLVLWGVAALLYLLFWSALAAVIATFRYRFETLAVCAGGAWLAIAVILPALASFAAEMKTPIRSDFELINGARQSSVEANRSLLENLQAYVQARPGLMDPAPTANDWAPKLYVSQLLIEAEVAPLFSTNQHAEAQRDSLADRLSYLSPTYRLDRLLTLLAGTGYDRQSAFEAQVAAFLDTWRATLSPRTFARQGMDVAALEALPGFQFKEPSLPWTVIAGPLLYLLVLGLLAVACLVVRLRGVTRLVLEGNNER